MCPQEGSARRLLRTSLVYPRSNSGLKLRNLDRAQPLQPAPRINHLRLRRGRGMVAIRRRRAVKRREFCSHACQAMSLIAVGSVLQGCSGGSSPTSPSGGGGSALPTVSGSVSNRTVSVTVDGASPLATVGGTALVQSSLGSFLVARISQDAFSALTAVCTHEGCTITNVSGQTYICPCHGSEYNTSGSVLKSPATRPLTTYATAFAGTTLTITT